MRNSNLAKTYFTLLIMLVSCGQDEVSESIDQTPGTFNEDVWVDPVIVGDKHTEMRVHVWFENQLIDFNESYSEKAASYSLGRLALRDQLVGELKALNNASMAEAKNMIDSLSALEVIKSVRSDWIVNGFTCLVNEGGIVALSNVPGVHSIFKSFPASTFVTTASGPSFHSPSGTDFTFDPTQDEVTWNIDSTHAPRVWTELGITGKGSKNIIHDFGFSFDVDPINESLYTNPGEIPDNGQDDDGNGYIDDYHGFDFENQIHELNVGSPNNKGSIHGNSVATVICGRKLDGQVYGVAPDSKWAAVIGLPTYAENLEWAIEMGFDTYTMSFSFVDQQEARSYWRKVSEHAALCGLFLISGAGNSGFAPAGEQLQTPEDIPYALFAVSGVDQAGVHPASSGEGPVYWNLHHYKDGDLLKPDFATFNRDIKSINSNGNGPISLNGNSFAGPHLAGVISLMLEANPNLNVWEVRDILISTSVDILDEGEDNKSGYGLVDAYEAVKASL